MGFTLTQTVRNHWFPEFTQLLLTLQFMPVHESCFGNCSCYCYCNWLELTGIDWIDSISLLQFRSEFLESRRHVVRYGRWGRPVLRILVCAATIFVLSALTTWLVQGYSRCKLVSQSWKVGTSYDSWSAYWQTENGLFKKVPSGHFIYMWKECFTSH